MYLIKKNKKYLALSFATLLSHVSGCQMTSEYNVDVAGNEIESSNVYKNGTVFLNKNAQSASALAICKQLVKKYFSTVIQKNSIGANGKVASENMEDVVKAISKIGIPNLV